MDKPWLRHLPIGIAALALAARLLPGPRIIDDAYITFRYAQNLLARDGFVFNPGERVLGTTTPVYTLLMAGLGRLSGGPNAPFPWLAVGLNALADAATCLLLVRLGERMGSRFAGLATASVWAVAPFSVTFAIGGMETSLFVMALTGLATAYLSGRDSVALALAALALLTRPDAILMLGPLAADWLLRTVRKRIQDSRRRIHNPLLPRVRSLIPIGLFLLPVLGWTAFAYAYFGSPIPHSVAAKAVAYRLPPEAAFVRLLQHYATPFFEDKAAGSGPAVAVGLLLYPALFLLGSLPTLRRAPRSWPVLAYPGIYFAVFSIANPLIFRWYLTPPLPFYLMGIFLGVNRIAADLGLISRKRAANSYLRESSDSRLGPPVSRSVEPRLTAAHPASVLLLAASTSFAILLSLNAWTLHPEHGSTRPAPEMAWIELELLFEQVGRELADEVRPDTVLAAGDVGALGYFSKARILDTVGLNSPESVAYYPLDPALYVLNYAMPSDLILDQQPTWVVVMESSVRYTLLREPRFLRDYRLRQKIPSNLYSSNGLLVFEHVEAAAQTH